MKTYIDLEGNKKLELNVYYSLGGMNYFNYKNEPRGYYGSVTPVTIERGMMQFNAFSGIKTFLIEVKRKNNRDYQQAIRLFEIHKQGLIDKVLGKETERTSLQSLSKKYGMSFPPAFEGKTEDQLLSTPVQVVHTYGETRFESLAKALPRLKDTKLCGPFANNGELRFESPDVYEMLSN